MSNLKTAIFVVVQSKGGVGKSTTASQFLAPFLVEVNGFTEKKVRYYEIDPKNFSIESLSNSTLVDSKLIKDPTEELERICLKEFADFNRDYPVIFDIGVGYYKDALETLSNVTMDENIVYIIPTKQDGDEVKNALETIEMIKSLNKNPQFVVACTDGVYEHGTVAFQDEFGIVFGKYPNLQNGQFKSSLFQDADIPEKFISVRKTSLLNQSKEVFRTTIYEGAKIGQLLHAGDGKPHELEWRLSEIKTLLEASPDTKTKKERRELEVEYFVIRQKMVFYKKCKSYYEKDLEPVFRDFGKML